MKGENKLLSCASNLFFNLSSSPSSRSGRTAGTLLWVSGVSLMSQALPNPPVHCSWFMSPETRGAARTSPSYSYSCFFYSVFFFWFGWKWLTMKNENINVINHSDVRQKVKKKYSNLLSNKQRNTKGSTFQTQELKNTVSERLLSDRTENFKVVYFAEYVFFPLLERRCIMQIWHYKTWFIGVRLMFSQLTSSLLKQSLQLSLLLWLSGSRRRKTL